MDIILSCDTKGSKCNALIGQLILEEIKCIKQEVKEEIRRLTDKFQDFVDAKKHLESHLLNLMNQKDEINYFKTKPEINDHENEDNGFPENLVDLSECLEDIEVPTLPAVQKMPSADSSHTVAESDCNTSNILKPGSAGSEELAVSATANLNNTSDVDVYNTESCNIENEKLFGTSLRKSQRKSSQKKLNYVLSPDMMNDTKDVDVVGVDDDFKQTFEFNGLETPVLCKDSKGWHNFLKVHQSHYQCKICGNHFKEYSSLKKHISCHTGKKPFKCQFCPKSFIQNNDLALHIEKIHKSNPENVEIKSTCHQKPEFIKKMCSNEVPKCKMQSSPSSSKSFPERRAPQTRSLNRSNALPVSVKTEKQIRKRSKPEKIPENYMVIPDHVIKNVNTVNGKKVYQCHICNKVFIYTSQSYRRHMMIHTGERPFKCRFCGKGFIRSTNLKLHLSTHTSSKLYTCKYCGTMFRYRSRLTGNMLCQKCDHE